MKRIILILIVLSAFLNVNAQTTYYVDNVGTGDTLSTIAEVNALTLSGGDSVLFKRDNVWRESLTVPSSGTSGSPVVFGSYGTGDNPVIDGADVISAFESYNIVENPSMELDADWVDYGTIDSTSQTDEEAHTGTYSWYVETTSFNGGIRCVTFQVESGESYVCKAWIYVERGTVQLARGVGRLADLTGLYTQSTGQWELLIDTITATSTGSEYLIITGRDSDDIFYVDDVSTTLTADDNIYYKTGIAIEPNLMYLNGVVGYEQASASECTEDGDWYWTTSGSDSLFVYSENEPSGDVELGQRKDIVDANGKSYITFENLTIQHSNEANNPSIGIDNTSAGIQLAANSTVTGCTIQENAYHGLYSASYSNIVIDNNTFLRNGETYKAGANVRIYSTSTGNSNITFSNNISSHSGHDGLRVTADLKVNGFSTVDVYGNTFDFNNAAGCYVQKAFSTRIHDNTFDGNGDSVDSSEDYSIAETSCDSIDIYDNVITSQNNNVGIETYSDAGTQYGSSNNVSIYRNIIRNISGSNGNGISIISHGDLTHTNTKIYYNVIDSVTGFSIRLSHVDGGSMDTVEVFNNTVYNPFFGTIYPVYSTVPVVAKNNILINDNSQYGFRATNGTTNVSTSNNLWMNASGPVLDYNSVQYTTSTITTFEASAQNTDPLFADAANGDFRVKEGSPTIGNGEYITGLDSDILGNAIDPNSVTIGAYQYQGVFKLMRRISTGMFVITKDTGENVGRTEY